MIEFKTIPDDHPALCHSPMVRGLVKTCDYIAEHGGIGLTPSRAFNRKFVEWAAGEFDWPGYTEADLYAINKVLNEIDFPPLELLHGLMNLMKLGRHYKGQFRLTRSGQALVGHPGQIFGTVVPFFVFRVNHASLSRFEDEPILGNWDIFLNVLNVETEDGATGADLRRVFYGEPGSGYDKMMGRLYVEVLRPLCWAGLLKKEESATRYRTEEALFLKTPLWKVALALDIDGGHRHV
ncbi:MAG: hypothetical protein TEF_18740 [Rhizobiales bacterium NRL2]|nr:MAG: hypothetical protein TEF_18740 [Rhizobiales bacterium NRL2]